MCLRIFITLLILISFSFTIIATEHDNGRILSRQKRIVFPQFTTLQLSMCLVAQVSYIPSHKVAVNTGFQINYGLPYNSSNFWSPVFWARSFMKETLLTAFFDRLSKSDDDFTLINGDYKVIEVNHNSSNKLDDNDDLQSATTENIEVVDDENTETTTESEAKPKSKRDVTAGEFYMGLKDTLSFAGYHDECLLKSVCELAKHPLVNRYNDDLIYELVHLLLTPSVHKGFDDENEYEEKRIYEEAEKLGKSGGDCDDMYKYCSLSPLHSISKFVTTDE